MPIIRLQLKCLHCDQAVIKSRVGIHYIHLIGKEEKCEDGQNVATPNREKFEEDKKKIQELNRML